MYRDQIKRTATMPAKGTLFNEDVGVASDPISEERADQFHHTVLKLLFVAKCVRLDIDLAVSFLCTRVVNPMVGDEEKLKRTLEYLEGTPKLTRIMGSDGRMFMQHWVDASYGIHRDMRGHNGGTTSLGRGVVMHNCSKQRLNTKSSTESELVGVSDYLPYTIWASYFLKEQGYKVQQNIFYQDNMSTIKMLENGRPTSSKSRHIHIRYFFAKDVFEREGLELQYCKTNEMIADYYTKPLQGKQFYRLRDAIMGLNCNDMLAKECVGNIERKQKNKTYKKTVASTYIKPKNSKKQKLPGTAHVVENVRDNHIQKKIIRSNDKRTPGVSGPVRGQISQYRVSNNFK